MTRARLVLLFTLAAVVVVGCASATTTASGVSTPSSAAHERPVTLLAADAAVGEPLSAPRWRVLVPPSAATPSAAIRVEPLLSEARALAMRFEREQALTRIARAETLLESDAVTSQDYDALHLTLAYRGLIESDLGHLDRADAALSLAARLRPDRELDPARFPPDLIARYDAQRVQARTETPAALTITTDPEAADVLLDGVPVGRTPLSLVATPGRHHVRIAAFGKAALSLSLELLSTGNRPLQVELPEVSDEEQALQLLALPENDFLQLTAAQRTRLHARLQSAVLVRVTQSADTSLRVSALSLVASGVASGTRLGSLPTGDRAALSALIAPLLPQGASEPAADGGSVLSSPWFWLSVGVVAAGVTLGIVMAQHEPDPVLHISHGP